MLHEPPIMLEAPLITIANMGGVCEQDHKELGVTSPGTLFGTPYVFGLFRLLVLHLALIITPEKESALLQEMYSNVKKKKPVARRRHIAS